MADTPRISLHRDINHLDLHPASPNNVKLPTPPDETHPRGFRLFTCQRAPNLLQSCDFVLFDSTCRTFVQPAVSFCFSLRLSSGRVADITATFVFVNSSFCSFLRFGFESGTLNNELRKPFSDNLLQSPLRHQPRGRFGDLRGVIMQS